MVIMRFIKAQTNGNDFVIFNEKPEIFSKAELIRIADRKFGIGCDQIIFVNPKGDKYPVTFFNNDGSYANMCGNGSCAATKYIEKIFNIKSPKVTLLINDTLYNACIENDLITVNFALPKIQGDIISTGNYHIVRSINEIDNVENIVKQFPECNIHFIDIVENNKIKVKTFERGTGWTLACGSGAVAVGFYSKLKGRIEIIHDGGRSFVEVLEDSVKFSASPKLVFEGTIYE